MKKVITDLLKLKSITPNQTVLTHMVSPEFNKNGLLYAGISLRDTDIIQSCYEQAKKMPGTTTKAVLKKTKNITLGEVFPAIGRACLLKGKVDDTAETVIVKILKTKDSVEEKACLKLNLVDLHNAGFNVVPYTVDLLDNKDNMECELTGMKPNATVCALISPAFMSTLDGVTRMTYKNVYPNAVGIVKALNKVHALGNIHMDVKSGNIFIHQNTGWYLGDFGSCVQVNAEVETCSDQFYKERFTQVRQVHLAGYVHDWFMYFYKA